jgi:hypothetical protein
MNLHSFGNIISFDHIMNNSEAEKGQKTDETLRSNSPIIGIEDKLQNLLTNPDFLKLKRTLNNSKNNLFNTLAASHLERWHSAFIRWILDWSSIY